MYRTDVCKYVLLPTTETVCFLFLIVVLVAREYFYIALIFTCHVNIEQNKRLIFETFDVVVGGWGIWVLGGDLFIMV